MAGSPRWTPFSRRCVRPTTRTTSSTATQTSQIRRPFASTTATHLTTAPTRFLSPGNPRSG
ncbi:MAG: hypothetical protein EBY61_08100, partial [Actinobacteria bacterium]|nr:hypothetical protein [Actinomycetota bacterium]